MKYFFLGQEKGSGTTSNMLAVAARLAVKYRKKVILLQMQGQEEALELAFYKNLEYHRLREECQYFLSEGFDLFLQGKNPENAEITSLLKELAYGRLYYFPMGKRELPFLEIMQYRKILNGVLEKLEEQADYVFLDCGTMSPRTLNGLKKKEDVYVVNLKQSEEAFSAFFLEEYDAAGEFLYLIGSYHADAVCNRKNLERIYRISPQKTGVVPYNPQFQNACRRGQLGHYLAEKSFWNAAKRDEGFRREMDLILKAIMQEEKSGEGKCGMEACENGRAHSLPYKPHIKGKSL